MIKTPLRVLLIEDDEDDYLLVRDYLGATGDATLRLEWAATYDTGRAALARREHDIALVDYRLGAHSGLDLLRAADGASDLPPTIILTGAGDLAVDAAAQTAGAFDFLLKGRLDASTLERSIRYTLDQSHQRVALAESQRFLQATLDALSAHIAVLDERGVVIAANAAWRCFAAQNDFPDGGHGLGMDYLAVCDAGARDGADGAAEVAAAIRDLLAGQRTAFVREYPCHGPRERRWFAIRISRFPGAGPLRLVVAHENVTMRHLAEERTRFQAQLLDQVPAAVIATDPAGLVTHWNAHATTLYGWTPAEALGRSAEMLIAGPADVGPGRAIFDRVAAGEVWAGEFPVRRKDGASFPAYVTDSAIRDEVGQLAGVVAVSVDISARKRAEEALRAGEHSYRELLEQAADAIFIFAPDGHFLTVNARACALTGYERAELLALEVADIMPSEEAGAIAERVATLAEGPRTRERLVRRKDGVLIPSEVSAALLDDGRVQIIIRDNTERKLAEAALRASEASLAEAQRVAHLGSWEYDYATKALHWSDEVFRIGGYVPQSFVPTPGLLESSIHPDDRERVAQAQRAAHAGGVPYDLDHRIVRPDGAIRTVHQQAELIRDASGRPLKRLGIVQDVTERRQLEGQLRHQAFHDALTGLPNRALLFERIGQALARARRNERSCAVLFLDLDRFKDVNDTAGHDTGDRLLMAVAARLRGVVRDGDTLARLGGDEFTLLLEDVEGPNEAVRTATRLRETLVAPLIIDGQEYRLTASIGIALGHTDHQRPEEVLRDADIAMYRAKEDGRVGYAVFDPAMQAKIVARLELERDLRHALDRQEFILYYQPIIDLRTGELAKVEALVRWQHPTRGFVSPSDFIPLAEETGLIRPLGRWVLGEACRQARAWQVAGTPVAIAVNLTALEFQHPDLAEEVAAALAEAGTEARWLRLEITESLAMRDVAATIDTLRALRAMGVAIAIDDFGTGYSSLAYLTRLPVSVLKIDKAFIDGLGTDEEETAIVAAIITLGHTLGLRVIAEGVETAAQAGLLRALGCDQAQGYHFARPLPAAAVAELLTHEAIREGRPGQGTRPRPTTGALRPRRVTAPRTLLPDGRGVASD